MKDDFEYLSQKFDNNVLDLVKQKGFSPYEYMSNFEKFKEELHSKEQFYGSLTGKKFSDKEHDHVLKIWNKLEMKTMKDYHNLYFKCGILLLTDVFEKFRNRKLKNYGLLDRTSFKLGCNAQHDKNWAWTYFRSWHVHILWKGMRGGVSYISNRYTQWLSISTIWNRNQKRSVVRLWIEDCWSLNIPIGNVKKLVPNLFDKEKYMIHYEKLQLYLRLGLKLKKIHPVLEFKQSQWLKFYLEFNTQKRIEAEKNSDKDAKGLYKLMNNAAYGKTMETLRNRIDVKLVSNKKD